MLTRTLSIFLFCLLSLPGISQDTVGITDIYLQVNGDSILLAYSKGNNELFSGCVKNEYDNHQLQFIIRYREGYKIDTKSFYKNGAVSEELNYVNGKLHGQYFCWDEEGKILIEGKYENGLEQGFWTFYNHGVRTSLGSYRYGCKSGIWKYFDERGKLIRREFWEGCKIHSVKEY